MPPPLKPGDVVTYALIGAVSSKRRPTVVISSDLYHTNRPDVILATLTTQVASATTPTGYILQDWSAAGLKQPTAFRTYLGMASASDVQFIGDLSERDWQGVQACLARALALPALF